MSQKSLFCWQHALKEKFLVLEGGDPRARAVGLLTSLYQRRLASSTYATQHSLENRAKPQEQDLKRTQHLTPTNRGEHRRGCASTSAPQIRSYQRWAPVTPAVPPTGRRPKRTTSSVGHTWQ